MTGETKVCRICGEEKELSEFWRCGKNEDGHRNNCKACSSEQKKEYDLKNN